jgi:hypothetical protein
MEPIDDLTALRAVLTALEAKGLVAWLTPEGRGRTVSHTLFTPREMESLKAHYGSVGQAGIAAGSEPSAKSGQEPFPDEDRAASVDASSEEVPDTVSRPGQAHRSELDELRSQLAQLRSDLDELAAAQRETDDQLQRLRRELGA